MTFTEAAVEVLRLVGKPLHYKKITELAIERNLLSHVGKTPEVTMSSRLATMVKRDRGEVPIIKVKPGVFGLREFSEEQLADLSGDVDELPEVEVEHEENKPEPAAEGGEGDAVAAKVAPEPRRPLPGADVFPEEEDDDEPILGGSDDDDDDDDDEAEGAEREGASQSGESRSSRRKRKRRRRGRDGGGDDNGAEEAAAQPAREERGDRNDRNRNDRDRNRGDRDRNRGDRDRNERRADDRNDRRERDRDRDRDRERDHRDRDRAERDPYADLDREPGDGDLLGKDLADAVASVLSQAGSRGMSVLRVADMLVRRGRLAGDPQALVPTIMAAVRADIARRKIERARPRFRIDGSALLLTDFLLPQDVTRAELEVQRAAERQRERARRAFLRCLGDLNNAGLAEVVATWLNAEGLVGLRAVRRPGSGPGELHLAGTLRRGVEEMRVAIVVYRDLRELGRERVIEARGALHYYGNASTAWLVTFGQVTGGAKEEAQAQTAAPVTLFDGMALSAAMERVGVGLSVQYVPVSAIDMDLLESLRGPRSDRDDRERGGRERERERGGRDRGERRPEAHGRPVADEDFEAEAEDEELDYEPEADDVEGEQAAVESQEGAERAEGEPGAAPENREGRKRRRRRRRRGGKDRDAAAAEGNAGENGEAGQGADWDSEEGEEGGPDQDEASESSDEDAREARGYDESDDLERRPEDRWHEERSDESDEGRDDFADDEDDGEDDDWRAEPEDRDEGSESEEGSEDESEEPEADAEPQTAEEPAAESEAGAAEGTAEGQAEPQDDEDPSRR